MNPSWNYGSGSVASFVVQTPGRCLRWVAPWSVAVAVVLAGGFSTRAVASTGDGPPPLQDLLKTVREHVKDSSAAEAAAAKALLDVVRGVVLGPDSPGAIPSDAPAVVRKERLEAGPLYVRVGQVSLGLAPQLAAILRDTNLVSSANGLVLDLRFASGEEYSAAASAADLFAQPGLPLLEWGNGPAVATTKTRPWDLPVAVLVNHETRAAAEALAAAIRSANAGLVLGSPTAGEAAIFREVPLPDGLRLRLATSPVRAGDGKPLGPEGVQPDIAVRTVASNDRIYMDDPFAVIGSPTGGEAGAISHAVTVRRRVTEAVLVRQRRGDTNPPASAVASPAKVIRDPVLARAVDLLRGLAALRPAGKESVAQ